jgi:acetylserotonin N-methyltransferase
MLREMSTPDASQVLFLLEAYRRSKVMFAAVTLGIFDRLQQAPAPLQAIAQDLQLAPAALEQLLDTCVALELLERNDGHYTNTPAASAYLCRNSPRRLTGYVHHSNAALWQLWDHLEDAVREGSNRWQQCFGSKGAMFSYFYRTDEARREFVMGMNGFGLLSSPAVVRAFDLSGFQHLVDVGGGTGHLAIEACKAYPKLRATVFDLASVASMAEEQVHASGLCDRVRVVAGDFLTDDLPPADLYAVGRILHDWGEEDIIGLLRKTYSQLPSGGGLLIAERLLYPDKKGPLAAHLQSLNMLVSTEGKERTLEEYTLLLQAAGFKQVDGRVTGTPLDAVLAIKP